MKVIDETEKDMFDLVRSDFNVSTSEECTRDIILNWLHLKARSIPMRPRTVVYSKTIKPKLCQFPEIREIDERFKKGADLTMYLGTAYHKKPKMHDADILFNDWHIHHLHLGRLWKKPKLKSRTKDLLFVHVQPDDVTCLDIRPHGAWADQDLVRILFRERPDIAEKYDLKGAMPGKVSTDNEVKGRRNAGLSSIISVDERVYTSPGYGISTSRHSTSIVYFYIHLFNTIRATISALDNDHIPPNIMNYIYSELSSPLRIGLKYFMGHFIVFEKNRDIPLSYTRCLS